MGMYLTLEGSTEDKLSWLKENGIFITWQFDPCFNRTQERENLIQSILQGFSDKEYVICAIDNHDWMPVAVMTSEVELSRFYDDEYDLRDRFYFQVPYSLFRKYLSEEDQSLIEYAFEKNLMFDKID